MEELSLNAISATRCLPVRMCQILVVPSGLPEASAFPSREMRRIDRPEMPDQGAQFVPARHVPKLHRVVLAARGQHLSVRRKVTDQTGSVCPVRVRSSRPLATSQSLMVRSTPL